MNILLEAISLHQAGNLSQAAALYQKALQDRPGEPNALRLLGAIELQLGNLPKAESLLLQAIKSNPNSSDCHYFMGRLCIEKKQRADAEWYFQNAIRLEKTHANALICLGILARDKKEILAALEFFTAAAGANPRAIDALVGQGACLVDLQRYDEAIIGYDRALAINSDFAEAWNGRSNALRNLTRYDEALAAYDKALAIKPDGAETWCGRGNVFHELNRHDDALVAYDKALSLKPDYAEAWNGRGNALCDLKRYDEAQAAYEKALAIRSDFAEAWSGRGNVFYYRKGYEQALAAYHNALSSKPDLIAAWLGRGNVYSDLKRYDEAAIAYGGAFSIKPDFKFLRGLKLNAQMHACDWRGLENEWTELLARLAAGEPISTPFPILAIPSTPEHQLKCAKLATGLHVSTKPIWAGERYSHERIRIAYLSADFHDHATAYLTAGLFEEHDRTRFETFALSFGPNREGDMRTRLKNSFDKFIDVGSLSDRQISETIRSLEIEIAVDLKGFTYGARPGIFATRAAPIHVNYIGFPGTMGADYIDYIIADRIVIPEEHKRFYSEKVVYLPESYQVNDRKRKISADVPTRAQAGLPEQGFVFCSFNNNYKITPNIFDVWMRLLKAVDDSVLWLLEDNKLASANLKREAELRGVTSERIIFAPRLNLEDHLARHRLADLFVDTLYCNAHTTASDALWSGLPVLTCVGETFAGRVAASLLRAVGLPKLATSSFQDYEALALRLARDRSLLASIKGTLARNRDAQPLFDTARFTRHLESAYTTMWQRYQHGEAPASFSVAPMD